MEEWIDRNTIRGILYMPCFQINWFQKEKRKKGIKQGLRGNAKTYCDMLVKIYVFDYKLIIQDRERGSIIYLSRNHQ